MLSVKIRTGFKDKSELEGILEAVAQKGVDEVIVHCRTRADLYRKEALDWSVLKPMHAKFPHVKLVANGDINDAQCAKRCIEQSGCSTLMCGRGGFMIPNIAKVIRDGAKPYDDIMRLKVMRETASCFVNMGISREKTVLDRTKQFLSYARLGSPVLAAFFKNFCRCQSVEQCFSLIDAQILELQDSKEIDHAF